MSAPRKFDEETRGASCGCSQSSQRWRSPSQSHSAWQRSHTPYSTTTWRQTLRQRPTPRRLPCRFQARRAASSRPRQRRRPTRSARSTLGLATATTPCRSHLTAPPSGSPPSRPSRARSRTPLRWSLPSRTQEHVERDHGITVDKDCGQSFTNRLTKKVRNDDHYRPGYVHSDSTQSCSRASAPPASS